VSERKYWYLFTYSYCPVCGREFAYPKVRVYDRPKPELYQDRHIVTEVYDYCGSL